MEVAKKGAVPRAEKEQENRGAVRILGSSIAGISFLVALFAFLLDIGESREYWQ
jgi:hypothetical protein